MENLNQNQEPVIQITGLKKQYKLGQIGGGTLTHDLQSWWARVRGKEDPNTVIGTDARLFGKTFMALNGVDLTVYKGEALGIIVSALTTKYRDLAIAVSFGVQLWMYISPVVYPLSSLEESPRLQMLMRLNPMTAPIEVFRMGTLGTGTVEVGSLIYSLIVTAAALVLGVVLFSRIEKTFMDTV